LPAIGLFYIANFLTASENKSMQALQEAEEKN
jgi:hypothetical protein